MLRARYLIPLVLFLVIAVFLAVGLTKDPSRVPSPLIGKPVPDFELPRLDADAGRIGPDAMQGEVWLLNIWATWCVGCREEHHVLMEAASRDGVRILGLDYKDERGAALRWLDQRGDPYFASAFDPEGRVGIDLGVYGVPETYVIDADGIIRHKTIGPVSMEDLKQEILPLVRRLQKGSDS
ncbi:MAG: DsbE family thiol:disulfide interchange protein [Halofilum sp. (in: g-proteobacteria)]|nr:DsbE family thiol:disulfide interchange protein [Halofilum sp. (in: g-proteobacteria)]